MSKVDVNVVGGAVPFSTGKETTTGRVKNANSVFKSYKSGVVAQSGIRPNNSYTYTATWNKNSVFFDGILIKFFNIVIFNFMLFKLKLNNANYQYEIFFQIVFCKFCLIYIIFVLYI